MATNTLQINGSRGELTPLMHARVDTEFYQNAYAKARNTVVTRYGPHTRVPGTLWFGDTKLQAQKSRMLSFEFSATQLYAIEFGHLYVRFWTPEGQVFDGPTPYEIVSTYTEADLPFLHGRQAGDELYLWCNGKRPQILKRAGETDWSFVPYTPKDGPYMDLNATPTTMTLSNDGQPNPVMTTNTAPAPFSISASNAPADAFELTLRSRTVRVQVSNNASGSINLVLDTARIVDRYFMVAADDNSYTDAMFTNWTLEGWNGAVWTVVDSRNNEAGWGGSEARYYEIDSPAAYTQYRIIFGGGGSSPTVTATWLGGINLHEKEKTATLTASSVTGINSNTGFKVTDIGRSIRLRGSDGEWRWAEISAWTSATVVTVKLNGHAFLGVTPIVSWAMGAWSDTDGWARTGRFFEDRLAQAGWAADPVGMALSVSAAYSDFRTSSPLVDDDAITLRMTGGRLDVVNWLSEAGTLIAGTGGGLRSIGGRDSTTVLKHDNLRQRLESSTAASSVIPTSTNNVVLYVDRTMRRLYEVGFDYQVDGYQANEVSVLNDHLFKKGVEQVDYVDAPYCTVLARRPDGTIIFFTYDRGQKIVGGTLCDFGGDVEDIMVMGGRTYPDVWLTVLRTVNGEPRRFIERLAPYWDGEIDPDAVPIYAANARVYDGAPTDAVGGLLNQAGETVGIWADGQDIGDAVVDAAGGLTLPYDKVASRIVVGTRMPFLIQTLRLPTQTREGTQLGRKMRIAKAFVDVLETARVYAGSLKAVEQLRSEDYSEHDPDLPEPMLTAMLPIAVDDSFINNGVFVIQGNSMYPATVRAISLEVEGED